MTQEGITDARAGRALATALDAPAVRVLLAVIGLAGLALLAAEQLFIATHTAPGALPWDWRVVSDAAQRVLHGQSYFLDRQIHGPYPWVNGDVLYPPAALLLFIPFSCLPDICWWLVPATLVVVSLRRLRPALWFWALAPWPFCNPQMAVEVPSGNPFIWAFALLLLAAAYRAPASLLLVKPTLLPFALFRLRTRAWWAGLAAVAVVSLALLPLSLQWVRVVIDSSGGDGLLHNIDEYPAAALALAAHVARRRA